VCRECRESVARVYRYTSAKFSKTVPESIKRYWLQHILYLFWECNVTA